MSNKRKQANRILRLQTGATGTTATADTYWQSKQRRKDIEKAAAYNRRKMIEKQLATLNRQERDIAERRKQIVNSM